MKIVPKAKIKDGYTHYEEGEEYEVDDSVGERFVRNGWATSPDESSEEADEESVTLSIDDSVHKQKTNL